MLNTLVTFLRRCAGNSPLGRWRRRRIQAAILEADLAGVQSWTDDDEMRRSFYSQFVKPDDLVFDVGANLGNRSKIFTRLQARVVGFEPQPYCVSVLQQTLCTDPAFTLEICALGPSPTTTTMYVSDAHTISTLSPQWIAAVKDSGRFGDLDWRDSFEVEVETLDAMIAKHGVPTFIKVDVEGFEEEVLKGLSQAVKGLSLEFTPEYLDTTLRCVERLRDLGFVEFRISLGESMEWSGDAWLGAEEIREALLEVPRTSFGDLYARC